MNKEIKKIFLVLGLYALAGGLFYNFQELWLIENNLSVSTIGIIYSLSAILTVSVIFLCSNLITQDKLKKFTYIILLLKSITIFILFLLNNTGYNVIIKFLIMFDYILDVEIYACVYPMITLITKDDKIYAARGLAYSVFYYIGVIFTSFLLGKTIGILQIDYNIYTFLASIVVFIAFIILKNTNLEQYNKKKEKNNSSDILYTLIKKIKQDKITKKYLLYCITMRISYYSITSLMVILFTEHLGFSPSSSSNIIMAIGIIAVFVGILILSKFTLKNNYINLFIKYGIRTILYILVVIFPSKIFILIAILYTEFFIESYSHISDAPYVNRFSHKYQLAFCNLKEMVSYFARSIGTLLCGITLDLNIRYTFLIAAIFGILQVYYSFKALNLLKKEKKKVLL